MNFEKDFKSGDRVVCMKTHMNGLIKGQVYTVSYRTSDNYICLKEKSAVIWKVSRFTKYINPIDTWLKA